MELSVGVVALKKESRTPKSEKYPRFGQSFLPNFPVRSRQKQLLSTDSSREAA